MDFGSRGNGSGLCPLCLQSPNRRNFRGIFYYVLLRWRLRRVGVGIAAGWVLSIASLAGAEFAGALPFGVVHSGFAVGDSARASEATLSPIPR